MFCGWPSFRALWRRDWVPKGHCGPLESHGCSLPQIGSCTMSWLDRLHGLQMQWSSSPKRYHQRSQGLSFKQGLASLSNRLREGCYCQALNMGYAGIIATLSWAGYSSALPSLVYALVGGLWYCGGLPWWCCFFLVFFIAITSQEVCLPPLVRCALHLGSPTGFHCLYMAGNVAGWCVWEQMVTSTSVTRPLLHLVDYVALWCFHLCGHFGGWALCLSRCALCSLCVAAFVAGLSECPLAMFPLTSVTYAGVGRCRLGSALSSPCTSWSECGCWGVCTLWCVGLEVRFASLSSLVHLCTCAACQVPRLDVPGLEWIKVPLLKVQVPKGSTRRFHS